MRNYVCLFTLIALFTAFTWNVEAKFSSNPISEEQIKLENLSSKKLTIKEKIALKKLQKQAKKSPKEVKSQNGFLGKLALGLILIVLGVLVIVGGIFALSFGSLLLGIAGVAVGAIVIAWGALDIVF